MEKLILTFLLFLVSCQVIGQSSTSKVLVRNSGLTKNKQTISVKWYSSDLIYSQGVNIYRKEGEADWRKINTQPIKRLDNLPDSAFAKDADLNFFVPLVLKSQKEAVKGLMLINLLVKTFESEDFAKFLGIQYEDTSGQYGHKYIYKINKVVGNSEVTIAESLPIIAGAESQDDPVSGILIKEDTNKVKINWRPEEQKFFAVNIYRTFENVEVKVNTRPLMISKYHDTTGLMVYPKVFYLDEGLKEGIYSYQISGIDFFGKETKRSETIKVEIKDLIPPPAPEGLKDSVNKLDVFINWTESKSQDVAGYNVYKSVKSDGPFTKLNIESILSTGSYVDKVGKPGQYYYYVSSFDKAGNEAKSNKIFVEVHDVFAPSQPVGLIARPDTGKIVLSWKMNNEEDLLGYRIYRTLNKKDNNNFVLLNTDPLKANQYTDKHPVNARNKFLYKIVALDSAYNSSISSEVASAQMPDIIPPVRPLISNVNNKDKSIEVSWVLNKDIDLLGYHIYRKGEGVEFERLNKNVIQPSVPSFVDNEVESSQTYYYYLTAVDSAGNESQRSAIQKGWNNYNTLTSTPYDIKLKYRKDKNDIEVSWKGKSGESFLGYVVFRRQEVSGNMRPVSGKVENHVFYDKDVKKGNTYYYEVKAFDDKGNIAISEIKEISIK